MKQVFNRVYTTNRWSTAGNGSGPGSDPRFAQNAIKFLRGIIQRYQIRTITDVSCGGMAWWPLLLREFPKIKFYGYDISSVIIEQNKQRFANQPNWTFGVRNAITDKFEVSDLMICRHTMMHLSISDAVRLLQNLISSKSRFLVLTSHPDVRSNHDTQRTPLFRSPRSKNQVAPSGTAYQFKAMNLELAPFHLKPIEFIIEPQRFREILGLYKLKSN